MAKGLVRQRGEFPVVLKGKISGQRRLIEVTEGRSERADDRPGQQV